MRYARYLRQQVSTATSAAGYFDPHNALTQIFHVPLRAAQDSKGVLSDLSFVAKENICTTTGATTCCSAILGAKTESPYESPFDATCIDLLRASGAEMLGKTNMDEFGMGSFTTNSPYGSTSNPHDTACTAGGSSGGSAAALFIDSMQDRGIDFALGTDTGGSVRIPASYCGLYGFKPTYGRISRLGIVPYANSLDTVGILTRKQGGIETIRRVFQLLDKHDESDPTSLNTRSRDLIGSRIAERGVKSQLRIGVPAEYYTAELDPAVLAVWRSSLHYLASCGHKLVPLTLPSTRAALAAYYILAPAEVSSNLAKYSGVFYGARAEADRGDDGRLYAATRSLFGDEVKRRILMGCLALSSDKFDNYYLQAQRIRRLIVHDFNRVFALPHALLPTPQDSRSAGVVDYIVTPTATSSAPRLDVVEQMTPAETHAADVFTVPASMAGLPSISVPYGQDSNKMPIGIQVIGQYGDDHGVLDLAHILGSNL